MRFIIGTLYVSAEAVELAQTKRTAKTCNARADPIAERKNSEGKVSCSRKRLAQFSGSKATGCVHGFTAVLFLSFTL